jgi:hypothetical protein
MHPDKLISSNSFSKLIVKQMKSRTNRTKRQGTRRGGGWGANGTVPDIKEKHTWGEFTAIVDELTKYGYDEFLAEHKKLYDEKDNLGKEGKMGTKRWQLLDSVINFNLMLMGNACRFKCPAPEPPVEVYKHWRGRGNM